MAEHIIARITDAGILANDLAENLSAKHQIALVGHDTDKGGESTATLDGYSMFPSNTQGLCCIHVSTDNVVLARETFNFSVAAATAAFDTWLSSRTTGVICMVSYGSNTSTTAVDTKFKSIGCENWQYYWKTTDGSDKSSFVGIYDCPLKKLMTYQLIGPGTTFDSARLQVQYDTFDDIGVTGYGDAIIWDETERTGTGYNYYTYLNNTPLSTLGLTNGETLEAYCELWNSQGSVNAGSRSYLFMQFYDNGSWKYSYSVNAAANEVNEWVGKRLTVKIPDGVTEVRLSAYKYPRETTATDTEVGVRDVVLKTRKPVVNKTRNGSAGQWGFITESAREVVELPVIASSQNKKLDAYRYGTIGNETFGRLSGTGYFQLPDWLTLSSKYTVEVSMIWDYDATVETMLSGQDSTDGRLMMGIRTDNNSSVSDAEGHLFYIENQVIRSPDKIVYGRTYTYTIAVNNTSFECFVNKQSVGKGTIQTCPRLFKKFLIGAVGTDSTPKNFCLGAATGCNLIDVNYPMNSKFYNLVLDGVPATDAVRGRSAFSGMPYTVEGNPAASTAALYCGPNTITKYGMQTGDECWVTVLDWGGNNPVNANWVLNKRYKCYVGAGITSGYNASNKFKIYNPDGGENWLATSGTMNTMIVRVEYTAHPECDATPVNIVWLPYKKAFIDFNGSVYYDIPPIAAQEDFIVKVQREALTQNGYILEGRLGAQTQECSMYIQPDGKLKQVGSLKIDRVNGVDYVDGTTTIAVGAPYVITGSLTHLGRIGARYDGGMAFKGFIGDLTIEDGNDAMNRHYSGYLTTPFVSRSTSVIDSNQKGILCYDAVNVHNARIHANMAVTGRQKWTYTVAGTGAGPVFTAAELGLLKGDRFRIEYDITASTDIGLHCCDNTYGAVNPIKWLPAGRNSGYVSYQHLVDDQYGIGLYIRAGSPKVGDYVTVNKLNVYRETDDGICSNSTAAYVYKTFEGPNIRTPTKRKWCPNFGTGWINIPKWTPDPKNFRIRATVIIPAATEQDVQTILAGTNGGASTIVLDIRESAKKLQFHTYNSAGTGTGYMAYSHNLNVGDVADIYIECVNNVATMKLNGKVLGTRTMTMDGTAEISHIGTRSSSSPWKYTSDILRVELTDTTNWLFNSRVYDLTKSTNIRPTDLLLQPDESYLKFLKIGQGSGYVGWDNSVYPEIGYFKDSHYINGYKMLYVKNDSTYSMRMKLDKGETPFGYFVVDFYESINEKPVKVATGNATVVSGEYCIDKTTLIDDWFKSLNATKRIIFRPKGAGSNLVLTNFTVPWREVSSLGAKLGSK